MSIHTRNWIYLKKQRLKTLKESQTKIAISLYGMSGEMPCLNLAT